MNPKNANFTQEVILPSKGYLNPEIPEGKLVQRCMMVADQKFIAGSNLKGGSVTQSILERTIVTPEGLDFGKLTASDTLYLLFKLRILSYGTKYKFRAKCPECGRKIDLDVDLSQILVNSLEEGYEKHLEVVLPNAGDKVFTKFLTNDDIRNIESESERRMRKFDNSKEDTNFILNLSAMIKKIELETPNENGDKVLSHPIDIQSYVEQLTDLDATAIKATTDNIEYGINPILEERCPSCGEYIDVNMQFGAGFFRPRYDL